MMTDQMLRSLNAEGGFDALRSVQDKLAGLEADIEAIVVASREVEAEMDLRAAELALEVTEPNDVRRRAALTVKMGEDEAYLKLRARHWAAQQTVAVRKAEAARLQREWRYWELWLRHRTALVATRMLDEALR